MKQILQNLQNGATEIIESPNPAIQPGTLLINTSRTVISAGTERMLQEFGKANWINKARQQPDKLKMVLDKIRTDGLMPTFEAVQAKLDQPIPLGYCNAGTVLQVGEGVKGFRVGDRVASNGYHAEVVRVPANLCARVPESVSDEAAAFTVLGAIALQGIRLAQPTLGETVVVSGLGLVGLIAVQLLRAQGCKVLGIDFDSARVELARSFGAETVNLSKGEDPLAVADDFSRGRGVDAVLIAAATKSSEPVSQAAKMCRKRGRIVLVGVTGLDLSRADFFEKELTFQVSCSYGPGRYDPGYEEQGHDYPVGFVRWTEQRNFEAILDMMADGKLDLKPLVSHRFSINIATEAYKLLRSVEAKLGIVLEYPQINSEISKTNRICLHEPGIDKSVDVPAQEVVVGFIGAGNYASRVLMPAFQKAGAEMHTIATSGSVSGVHFGRKFGFHQAVTDAQGVLENSEINTVVIATRHDSHAQFTCAALNAGKNVFVEKPLALTIKEVKEIQIAYDQASRLENPPVFMVGFNRRFAPQVVKMKELLEAQSQPKSFILTINAGAIPVEHWTQDPKVGGGRIIGEACHFLDLLRFLAESPISKCQSSYLAASTHVPPDTVILTLSFEDGSIGTIHYFANGARSFPKERIEVFCGGGVLQLDNFRKLKGFGWPGFSSMNLHRQDKGHQAIVREFVHDISASLTDIKRTQSLFETSQIICRLSASE